MLYVVAFQMAVWSTIHTHVDDGPKMAGDMSPHHKGCHQHRKAAGNGHTTPQKEEGIPPPPPRCPVMIEDLQSAEGGGVEWSGCR